MTVAERAARTDRADDLCRRAFGALSGPATGVALIAVGGYGRGELAPFSDLDLVLVHDDGVDPGELAEKLWYPLWDSRAKIDHSVRSESEVLDQSERDLRVALGLLDTRHVAGDPNLTLRVRGAVLTAWRRDARSRLGELRSMVSARHELVGELAQLSVPDLKEGEGGLRDATVLKALVASWVVDVPHADLERCRQELLDLRDIVHDGAGRGTDRITPETWEILAGALSCDAGEAQRRVRRLGRRMAHLSRLTWRRAEASLRPRPRAGRSRRPELVPLAPGVAESVGEVVLAPSARPDRDAHLLLRCAVEAAERDLVLSPVTAARLAKESAPIAEPWPEEARQLMVRLLASGRALLPVWETLDETGAIDRLLPEWERIRLLPHASIVHRFTVDRHVVETCVEASQLIRTVDRPDVLMVAALLHDIGKGGLTEHSVAGEPIARKIAARIGMDEEAVDLVALLVRRHLLLVQTATTRDIEDPHTVRAITAQVPTQRALALLSALTEADARATSAKAWTAWRAGLVRGLSARVAAELGGGAPRALPGEDEVAVGVRVTAKRQRTLRAHPGDVDVVVEPGPGGALITVVAMDRIGLLADVAAGLALMRIPVRAARAWSVDDWGCSQWQVADEAVDPAVLRQRIEAVASRAVDPAARLRPTSPDGLEPVAVIHPDASRQATVLEIRAADRPGVLYAVFTVLANLDIGVVSAHVDTVGPQIVDVFYLHETGAQALGERRAAEAAHAVRSALTGGGAETHSRGSSAG